MYANRGKKHETMTQTQGYTDRGKTTTVLLLLKLILFLLGHYVCAKDRI